MTAFRLVSSKESLLKYKRRIYHQMIFEQALVSDEDDEELFDMVLLLDGQTSL